MNVFHATSALLFAAALSGCRDAAVVSGLSLELTSTAPSGSVVASYAEADRGGNTSIAFDEEDIFKWSGDSPFAAEGWGYFDVNGNEIPYIKRDRDLGQTFRYDGASPARLAAITVSTGYGTNVVRPGMYGKSVSVQLFEVSGTAVVNDNGSGPAAEAFHGFPHDRAGDSIPHYRDDYFAGEVFTSLAVFHGAVFPRPDAFGIADSAEDVRPDHPSLKGRYLRFAFPPGSEVVMQPGRQYGFLIMIDRPGTNTGFTLANHYRGNYAGGHGIRRDGNGVFPPEPADPGFDFTAPGNETALASAHFPVDFDRRCAIAPGTNGYPDVDTFRDLVFFIEAR